jgi:hypothetical protein
VKTRRLLVATGHTGLVREFPLEWNRSTYLFDFAFEREQTILEVNGRRWHDDVSDYEHDNEKWSVPGRHGYRIVLATWDKVTRNAGALLQELEATLAPSPIRYADRTTAAGRRQPATRRSPRSGRTTTVAGAGAAGSDRLPRPAGKR